MTDGDQTKWKDAMDDEMKSYVENSTWELIRKPIDVKLISCEYLHN